MASSSGNSSGSGHSTLTTTTTTAANSASEGDLHQYQEQQQKQLVIDQRKQKRKLSNRESAKRSRMRKQKHLDDLAAQVARLRSENNQILTTYKITTQQYIALEAQNSVLRAQFLELSTRLQSISEIISHTYDNNSSSSGGYGFVFCDFIPPQPIDNFIIPWNTNMLPVLNHPIMASPEMQQS